jgi:hypothetical protein
MKRSSRSLALLVMLTAFCSIFALGQEASLKGTWLGTTFVPDVGEDEVTLVLAENEGKLAATMTDTLGMLADTACEDIEFQEGTLTFKFTISQNMETQTIWMTLEKEGDQMKGYWETADGEQGDIAFTKR